MLIVTHWSIFLKGFICCITDEEKNAKTSGMFISPRFAAKRQTLHEIDLSGAERCNLHGWLLASYVGSSR
jgi:hypothetical protein